MLHGRSPETETPAPDARSDEHSFRSTIIRESGSITSVDARQRCPAERALLRARRGPRLAFDGRLTLRRLPKLPRAALAFFERDAAFDLAFGRLRDRRLVGATRRRAPLTALSTAPVAAFAAASAASPASVRTPSTLVLAASASVS